MSLALRRIMVERWQRRWWRVESWLMAAALTWRLRRPGDQLSDLR